MNHERHGRHENWKPQITRITQILTTKHTKQTKSLAAGPTLSEGFNDKNKMLIMNDANGSGGSAVLKGASWEKKNAK